MTNFGYTATLFVTNQIFLEPMFEMYEKKKTEGIISFKAKYSIVFDSK